MQEIKIQQEVTEKIFSNAVLLNPTIGYWMGRIQQNENDLDAQGVDKAVMKGAEYEAGSKWLIAKSEIDVFTKIRSEQAGFMRGVSFDFPVRAVRFVPVTQLDYVRSYLRDTQARFYQAVDSLINRYDGLKEAQMTKFMVEAQKNIPVDKLPEFQANLAKAYPSKEELRNKFNFGWIEFEWRTSRFNDIKAEENQKFREETQKFLQDCAKDLRKVTAQAATAFMESISNAKGKVNDRSIRAFEGFMDKFQRLNFMGDRELERVIQDARQKFVDIESWNKGEFDERGFAQILSRAVEVGANQGSDIDFVVGRFLDMEAVDEAGDVEVVREEQTRDLGGVEDELSCVHVGEGVGVSEGSSTSVSAVHQ
jgi:hypothetical protein